MATRSPWTDARIKTCFGEDLPPILRHHQHPRSYGLTKKWRHVVGTDPGNKPLGGLFTAPVYGPAGKWRPIPRRSTWTDWCESEAPEWINGRYQTQLFPERDAVLAVIDSAADARALYDAFPDAESPMALMMRELQQEMGRELIAMNDRFINWAGVLTRSIAGVYVTERGFRECRWPEAGQISLHLWDAATVWWARPAYRIGKTWKSPRVGYDDDPPFVWEI